MNSYAFILLLSCFLNGNILINCHLVSVHQFDKDCSGFSSLYLILVSSSYPNIVYFHILKR